MVRPKHSAKRLGMETQSFAIHKDFKVERSGESRGSTLDTGVVGPIYAKNIEISLFLPMGIIIAVNSGSDNDLSRLISVISTAVFY